MAQPIVFGVVGGRWRAEFYFRIAQALPGRFRVAGCVAKSETTRARVKANWNIPVFDKIDGLLNEQPEFVVTSVPWAASEPLLLELASRRRNLSRIDEALSGNREVFLQSGRGLSRPLSEPHDR